jgi:hypothetical protein
MLNLELGFGVTPHAGVLANDSAETSEPECRQLSCWAIPYQSLKDVICDAQLTVSEKKAILSYWASDACAVESRPALRKPPGLIAPILYDEIMEALQFVDGLQDA